MAKTELTTAQRDSLRRLPITVYSPGVRTIQEFGPLEEWGLVRARDVGSDEAQETILELSLTDEGRAALEGQS